jgi:hypothetical protein
MDDSTLFQSMVNYWERASIQIQSLCATHDFAYFHFLQPNQYVEGSKTLTDEELKKAYQHGLFANKEAVQQGYKLLRAQGTELKERGVKFTDLVMMFKNEPRTVYNDKCCHFNQLGYDLIAEKIGNAIIAFYSDTE